MPHSIGRRSLTLAALFVVVVALAACASSAPVPRAGAGVGAGSVSTDTTGGAPIPAATAAPAGAPNEFTSSGDGVTPEAPTALGPTGNEVLIIRTGSLALEVTELDATLLKARATIVGLGGYVSDSQRSDKGDTAIAVITYRIPADRWEDALDGLGGLATKVLSEDTKAVEVTGQVLDLGARITNLQATERALQAIMAQAVKISDILEVQNQLTAIRGQIEQLSTQKSHLSDQAAMGTLAVTYTLPVVAAVKEATTGWSLATELDRALAQLVQLGQGVAVLGVWLLVVGLPLGIGLAVFIGLLILIGRRIGLIRPRSTQAGLGTPAAS